MSEDTLRRAVAEMIGAFTLLSYLFVYTPMKRLTSLT